jgi:putative ABC transport system permease protein
MWWLVAAVAAVLAAAPGLAASLGPAPPPSLALTDRSARLLGVRQGDAVEVARTAAGPWRVFRVAHVYQPPEYPTEISRTRVDLRLHLTDLEALDGAGDSVDSVVVRVRPGVRPEEVAARLDTLPLGFRAYTSDEVAAQGSSTFEVIARFHRAISVVTLLASSVFLLTIMTLRGEEMRRHVGVMRLVGISRRSIAVSLLLIAAGVAVAGSLAGVGLGYALSAAINLYYRRLFDTPLVFSAITWPVLAEAVGLSVLIGLAAGAATAWRLLRRPAREQLGR